MTGSIHTSEGIKTSKSIPKFKPGQVIIYTLSDRVLTILEIGHYRYKILNCGLEHWVAIEWIDKYCRILTEDEKVSLL
jgi:hypothetical protein